MQLWIRLELDRFCRTGELQLLFFEATFLSWGNLRRILVVKRFSEKFFSHDEQSLPDLARCGNVIKFLRELS